MACRPRRRGVGEWHTPRPGSSCRTLPPARRDEAVARIANACGLSSDDSCRPLSWDELSELDRHPNVEIGAHTASHPVLAELEHEEQRREILGGKRDLESILGHPVQLFSYPHGQAQDFTPETVELVRDSGFLLACSAVGGLVTGDSDVYRLPRVAVPGLGLGPPSSAGWRSSCHEPLEERAARGSA